MKSLFIDIETAQTQNKNVIQKIENMIEHPKAMKKAETIAKWEIEQKPDAIKQAIEKTSFNGLQGEIICICYAVGDEEVRSVGRYDPSVPEADMLKVFWKDLIKNYGVNFNPEWVGHNITGFDLRFLFHRCIVNNIKPSIKIPYNEKPWSFDIFDTLYEVMGLNSTGGSLDTIAEALGIRGKLEGMDGSKVNQYWLDGRYDEIVDYCVQDVEVVRNIYKRLKFIEEVGDE